MKIILSLILTMLITSPSWAYLTAGKVAVTKTGSSLGVSSTSQDSDISDALGSNVTIGVPLYDNQICLGGVCETSWPSGGSQTTGSSVLAGNGLGGFTNITMGSTLSYNSGILSQTSNVNFSGQQLGVPSAKSAGAPYQASTDGYVEGWINCEQSGNPVGYYKAYSDSSSSPSTIVSAGWCNVSNIGYAPIYFHVNKGNYWEVNITITSGSNLTSTINWIPQGS